MKFNNFHRFAASISDDAINTMPLAQCKVAMNRPKVRACNGATHCGYVSNAG